jgi:1-acyl-sn-glycerol-3-phosphate acyltransferase
MKMYAVFPLLLQRVLRPPVTLFLKAFYTFTVANTGVPSAVPAPAIFASNHLHWLDVIVINAAIQSRAHIPLFYVSREKLFYSDLNFLERVLYGGLLFSLMGAFPANSGRKDYGRSLGLFLEILSSGYSVCIFPYGGREKRGTKLQVHGGVAYLCEQSGAPLIPVKVTYGMRSICVSFGEPLTSETLLSWTSSGKSLKYKAKAACVMKIIDALDVKKPHKP